VSSGPRFSKTRTKVGERMPSRERRIRINKNNNKRIRMRRLSNMILVNVTSHCLTLNKDLLRIGTNLTIQQLFPFNQVDFKISLAEAAPMETPICSFTEGRTLIRLPKLHHLLIIKLLSKNHST
jgi:hypothetical protein